MKRARVTKELRSALRERAWEASRSTKDGSPIPVLTISAETLASLLVDLEAAENDLLSLRRQIERLAAHARGLT